MESLDSPKRVAARRGKKISEIVGKRNKLVS